MGPTASVLKGLGLAVWGFEGLAVWGLRSTACGTGFRRFRARGLAFRVSGVSVVGLQARGFRCFKFKARGSGFQRSALRNSRLRPTADPW